LPAGVARAMSRAFGACAAIAWWNVHAAVAAITKDRNGIFFTLLSSAGMGGFDNPVPPDFAGNQSNGAPE
jgi:hypothetical protein